jgi:(R,R)-butanediol dehydrogenase/meso-butanediol dehydrogenase/diacetyl reductase
MRVALFHEAGRIAIEQVPDDPLLPTDVRIEIERCGICGSDVVMTSGSDFDFPHGCRLGHESAGTVIETGREVTTLKVGDRVSVFPTGFCGQCPMCLSGRPLFCPTGRMQFGGFGERMVIVERSGFRYPDSVSHAEGALVEPIACGRKAMRMGRLTKGQTVLVLGAGSMGLAATYWARHMGAGRVVVATRTAARHEAVLAIGADAALALGDDDPDAYARALPEPPDIVVECIGKPGVLHMAAQKVRLGGTVLSMGMCVTQDPILPAFNAFNDVTLAFPVSYTTEDFIETIRSFDADKVRPEVMVAETISLARLPGVLDEMRGHHSHLKVQVDPRMA